MLVSFGGLIARNKVVGVRSSGAGLCEMEDASTSIPCGWDNGGFIPGVIW